MLAPKGLAAKYIKDWATEKALQLSFLRKDWLSFRNIIHAKGGKRDDLSDTIVQLEALCKHLGLATTPVPATWDQLPVFAGWQSGMIFFRSLIGLMGIGLMATNIIGWISILVEYESQIVAVRNTYNIDPLNYRLIPISRSIFPASRKKFNLTLGSTTATDNKVSVAIPGNSTTTLNQLSSGRINQLKFKLINQPKFKLINQSNKTS